MDDLTAFQRDLLYVMAGLEEASGLALKEELEAAYEEAMYHSRIYPNLDTLAERGVIQKEAVNQRTNAYTLTDKGRELLKTHRDWVAGHVNEGPAEQGQSAT